MYNRGNGSKFQSTPAHERATVSMSSIIGGKLFQSTPAHERATLTPPGPRAVWEVSIHARSRAGDITILKGAGKLRGFNPRPLTSGRRESQGS